MKLELNKNIKNLSDNLNFKFGEVKRSSSLFWIAEEKIKSIFSISNYWLYKNNVIVRVFATWRTKEGHELHKQEIDFSNVHVVNISPPSIDLLGGSVEIETFSDKDLRIPYSAVVGVYQSDKNIAMVHSYTRILNENELDKNDKNEIGGSEGCWVLKDTEAITSFCVFHNGTKKISDFEAVITIKNFKGDILKRKYKLELLNSYQTVCIKPKDLFDDLVTFLDGEYGSAKIRYSLGGSFTRMLIGWYSNNGQITVTHSNFNYIDHSTDYLSKSSDKAYVIAPIINVSKNNTKNDIDEVIVYDGREQKEIDYFIGKSKNSIPENQKEIVLEDNKIIFQSKSTPLPSRIVNGLVKKTYKDNVGYECSLGVMNNIYPKKRFHWGLASFTFKSNIYATIYRELFGDISENELLTFRLYGTHSKIVPEKIFNWNEIGNKIEKGGISLSEIFPDQVKNKSFDTFFYVSVFSYYGGFFFFTDLIKNDLRALEHSF